MRTPVWNHAVGTIWCVAPAAVADDRVIGNAGSDWQFVYGEHEPVVRLERIHTVGHAIELPSRRICDQQRLGRRVNRCHEVRSSYQGCADAADPARSYLAAAVRRRDKNNSLDLGAMIEDERLLEQIACRWGQRCLRR